LILGQEVFLVFFHILLIVMGDLYPTPIPIPCSTRNLTLPDQDC